MREAMAIASFAILFGITGANANNTQTDQNVLQVAQSKRLHPLTSKGLHPALTGAYR